AERLALEPALLELELELLRDRLRTPLDRAAQRRDAGARALVAEPRVVELMVTRGGAKVPHDRLVALRQQREPDQLVHRPRADVRGGDVADVRHVEAEQRAELRLLQRSFRPRQPLRA